MRTPFRYFLFSLLFCGFAYAQVDTITILHVNDTHSNLLPYGPRDAGTLAQKAGGIARLSTYLDESRSDDPELLFLHAGDASVGDLMYNALLGMVEFELLESMGLNAMALGNHEFDLGAPILEAVLDSVNVSFPLLSANFTLLDPTLASLDLRVMPETIFEVKGHKIGVFGLTTPTTNMLSNAYPHVAFADTLIPDLAAASVQSLRAQGCEAVILLSHLGLNGDILIAEQIPGVDLIIGGHDHRAMDVPVYIDNPRGGQTPIVQAGAFYHDIGVVRLAVGNGTVSLAGWRRVPLDENVDEDPITAGYLDLVTMTIEQAFAQPLFTEPVATVTETLEESATDLFQGGPHDTPVGNLVTDAFRAYTGADIAVTAGGATAQPLYKGPVTANDVFRMIGYGFNTSNYLGYRIVTFDISGMGLLLGLEYGLSQIELGDEVLIQSSGLSYAYNPHEEAFQRVLHDDLLVGGQPLNLFSRYTVTCNEFIASIFDVLLTATGVDTLGNLRYHNDMTELEVVLAYLRQAGVYSPVRRSSVVAPVDRTPVPDRTIALGHHPNPVRGVTDVVFDVPVAGDVDITLYDVNGRKAATIVNERLETGRYVRRFDATALPPGMYTYILRVGTFSKSQKMVRVR